MEKVPAVHPSRAVRNSHTVLMLRESGSTWNEIAETLGLADEKEVRQELERAARILLSENPENLTQLRNLVGRRIDRLLKAVWKKAIDPDNPEQMVAQQRALQLIAQQSVLFGLNAPTRHEVDITPTQSEIASFVSAVMEAKNQMPEEMDIFEAEVIENEEEAV